ncbi:TPA: hypothetical protein ACIBE3_005070, partial [Salmonella enterica subsp. enterica serovar Reading]
MKYSGLQEHLDDVKRREQHKKRLADKLFHTVRSGSDTEIQSVIKECSESGLDFKDVKHDYLLEYFDSFHNRFIPPSIPI